MGNNKDFKVMTAVGTSITLILSVTVVITDVEEGHVAQVAIGCIGYINEVAAHFSKKDCAVGNGLQFVEDANNTVNSVCGIIQFVVFCEDDML